MENDDILKLTREVENLRDDLKDSEEQNEVLENFVFGLEKQTAEAREEAQRAYQALERAKAETDLIMNSVSDAIFLIDEQLKLGAAYSRSLETMFEERELSGKNFPDLLGRRVEKEISDSLRDFLELTFLRPLRPEQYTDLNPLTEISASFDTAGKIKEKWLSFQFSPLLRENGIAERLLVVARDLTYEKNLEKKIENERAESNRQMELMYRVLSASPALLKDFLGETRREVQELEDTFAGNQAASALIPVLQQAFRIIHSIKGNATLIGVQSIVELAHQFEENIKALYKRENLSGLDILPLLDFIFRLKQIIAEMQGVIDKVRGFQASLSDAADKGTLLGEALREMCGKLAANTGKRAEIHLTGFELLGNLASVTGIKDILIQLVRNSFAHGIEDPAEREKRGKAAAGQIMIAIETQGDFILVRYRDDGNGIDINRVATKAVRGGLIGRAEVVHLKPAEIAEFIFHTNFSTRDEADLTGGQGVGLDIVKKNINRLGGWIKVQSKRGHYTQFIFALALQALKNTGEDKT